MVVFSLTVCKFDTINFVCVIYLYVVEFDHQGEDIRGDHIILCDTLLKWFFYEVPSKEDVNFPVCVEEANLLPYVIAKASIFSVNTMNLLSME